LQAFLKKEEEGMPECGADETDDETEASYAEVWHEEYGQQEPTEGGNQTAPSAGSEERATPPTTASSPEEEAYKAWLQHCVRKRKHVYSVDLSTGDCTCPDRVMVGFVCKHIFRALQERGKGFADLPKGALDTPTLSCDWDLIYRVRIEHLRKRKRDPMASGSLGLEEEEVSLPKTQFYHRPANLEGHTPPAPAPVPCSMVDDGDVEGIAEEMDSPQPEEDESNEEVSAADARARIKHDKSEYAELHMGFLGSCYARKYQCLLLYNVFLTRFL
jgi:hypothetical protein